MGFDEIPKEASKIGDLLDFRGAEMLAQTKTFLDHLNPIVDAYYELKDLIAMKDHFKSMFFLITASLAIQYFELAVALIFPATFLFIQYNAYYHRPYVAPAP